MVKCLRTCLTTQETWVWSLAQEDPRCCGLTKLMHHNYWGCALEPKCHNCWACMLQRRKPAPRSCVPQQEKPLQREAYALQLENSPALCNWRKSLWSNKDPAQPKIHKHFFFLKLGWNIFLFNSLVITFNSSNDFVQAEKNVSTVVCIHSYAYQSLSLHIHTHKNVHTHTHTLIYSVKCMTGTKLVRGNIKCIQIWTCIFYISSKLRKNQIN